MSKITDETRAFIVRRFACYESTGEIREAVKEEFGVELTSSEISYHNPANASFALGQDWLELYHRTRENFQRALDDVGIAHKAYRLQKLDQMERAARKAGNYGLAKDMLKEAREEVEGKASAINLQTLQTEMDRLAAAVVREVKDPDALARIERAWSGESDEGIGSRIKKEWGV